tara:strand:- start:62245 stop:63018 length:774 start_codon:yes stop_codon:yes gene_type:complete
MQIKRIILALTLILALFIVSFTWVQRSFKDDQKRYPRVRTAYAEKFDIINNKLSSKSLSNEKIEIYLRVFKFEKELELWGRNKGAVEFKKIKTFEVCNTSGNLGPKRKQGDFQIPEGFYHIDRFNPSSNFYLSMGINYPNRSDRILGEKGNLGGDIFIHGACVTIGCVPITDDLIKELYVYCVEAKNNGQQKIPVTIFPAKMTEEKYKVMCEEYKDKTDELALWKSLKKGYDYFNSSKKLPSIGFLDNGQYNVIKNN